MRQVGRRTCGRIKIKVSGNAFFDISDANFLVGALSQCESPNLPLTDPGSVSDDMTITGGEELADLNVTLDIDHSWVGDMIVTLEHVDTGTSVVMIDRPGSRRAPRAASTTTSAPTWTTRGSTRSKTSATRASRSKAHAHPTIP